MNDFDRNEIINVDPSSFAYADIYRATNDLIRAKYTSTIEEANIMSIAQNKIYHGNYELEQSGSVIVSFKASEYRNLLGAKGNSIYRNLKDASIRLTNKAVEISDDRNKNFIITSMVEQASYINGVFSIRFAREFKDYMLETSSHSTELDLKTTLSFGSYCSKKLYEELKSYMYLSRRNHDKEYNGYSIRFGLDELKFMFGLIDITDPRVNQILKKAKNGQKPDYAAAAAAAKKSSNKYRSPSEFRRSFIEPAIQEINGEGKFEGKGTDIHVEMNIIKGGKGGAIREFEFIVTNNEILEPEEEPQENAMTEEEMIDALIDLVDVKLNLSNAKAILNAADWDYENVKKAYSFIVNSVGLENVSNFVGYMIDAVNGDYVLSEEKKAEKEDSGEAAEEEEEDKDRTEAVRSGQAGRARNAAKAASGTGTKTATKAGTRTGAENDFRTGSATRTKKSSSRKKPVILEDDEDDYSNVPDDI